MQIIEISEPGEHYQDKKANEQAVGIDFGTTNSVIAFSHNGICKTIKNTITNQELIPSILKISNDGIVVGNNGDEHSISPSISYSIGSIKRLLAKSYDEITQNKLLHSLIQPQNLLSQDLYNPQIPIIEACGKKWNLVELAAKIFSHLKTNAEDFFNYEITKAVVTVPAYFDASARGQIMMAAKVAGFEVLRLIAEPTAAAYAYGLNKNSSGSYLIYDLGGGTFDVSVLEIQTGILQVIASAGDNMLGGDDIDHLLAEYIAHKVNTPYSPELIAIAKNLKETLSSQDSARAIITANKIEISLTKLEFENLIAPIINKTIRIAKKALQDSEISIDGIILIGGSSRIPAVNDALTKAFKVKILNNINPDIAVAHGAALQAENLTNNPNSILLDIIPLSLGVELYGGIVEKIIMRNNPIPCAITKNFTTQIDNQTGLKLHILQGERELAQDCRSLASFELKGIPPMKAGLAKIEVTFALDADGILAVTACEILSAISQTIEINPSFGISEADINRNLMDAFKNSETDHQQKLLAETKISAENLVIGMLKALKETPDILSKNEQKNLITTINSLQNVINSDNRDKIILQINQVNNLAKDFIQKHLNKGAENVIIGKNIKDM